MEQLAPLKMQRILYLYLYIYLQLYISACLSRALSCSLLRVGEPCLCVTLLMALGAGNARP